MLFTTALLKTGVQDPRKYGNIANVHNLRKTLTVVRVNCDFYYM